MSMSRKDYNLIANVLQHERLTLDEELSENESIPVAMMDGFDLAVKALGDLFAQENPRFDRERFDAAVFGYRRSDLYAHPEWTAGGGR